MSFRILSLGTLSMHLFLGNLCMMPMAMAEEIQDMSAMTHDMAAMTSQMNDADQEGPEGMPCDQGHCFTHALPTESSSWTTPDVPVEIPIAFDVFQPSFVDDVPAPTSAAPPGQFIHVETIVLRN